MSIMYAVLWAGYYGSQPDIVAKIQGRDFVENVSKKRRAVGRRRMYWNFAGHPYVGSEYYLFFAVAVIRRKCLLWVRSPQALCSR